MHFAIHHKNAVRCLKEDLDLVKVTSRYCLSLKLLMED